MALRLYQGEIKYDAFPVTGKAGVAYGWKDVSFVSDEIVICLRAINFILNITVMPQEINKHHNLRKQTN